MGILALVIASALLGDDPIAKPAIINVGGAKPKNSVVSPSGDGRFISLPVAELDQGGDLTGNGLQLDLVPFVVDVATRRITHTGLAMKSKDGFASAGKWLLQSVSEEHVPSIDLNGDGDIEDSVMHLIDVTTGIAHNTGIAAARFMIGERLAVLLASEHAHGVSFNGDSDAEDIVVFVLDLVTGRLTNLGVAANNASAATVLRGSTLAFVAEERDEGVDLNEDNDRVDGVFHVYDADTQTVVNTGLAGTRPVLGAGFVAMSVSEHEQGEQDLDHNGWVGDGVYHIFDLATQEVTNLGFGHPQKVMPQVFGALIIARAVERPGWDVNGNGAFVDSFPLLLHVPTGSVRIIPRSTNGFVHRDGDILAWESSEGSEGNVDLNGDGDTKDAVVSVHRLSTNETWMIPLAAQVIDAHDGILALEVSEKSQGGSDLNGDGWVLTDSIVFTYDTSTGVTWNTGLISPVVENPRVLAGHVLATRRESDVGVDLNDDGDVDDSVFQWLDVSTQTMRNLGVAGFKSHAVGDVAVLEVNEGSPDNDFNGDGDTTDIVFHILVPPSYR